MSATIILLDGMEHTAGSAECCKGDPCVRCGGIRHWQIVHVGCIEICETCDAEYIAKLMIRASDGEERPR